MKSYLTPIIVFLLFRLLILLPMKEAVGIAWLSLYRSSSTSWTHPRMCRREGRQSGLSRGQMRICRRHVELMGHVTSAAHAAVHTCQALFRYSRWNCSTIITAPNPFPDLTTGTREQAVVYALGSAAVAWAVAKACSQGSFVQCGCGKTPSEPPNGHFKWGGCGDNVKFGTRFARDFVNSKDSKRDRRHAEDRRIPFARLNSARYSRNTAAPRSEMHLGGIGRGTKDARRGAARHNTKTNTTTPPRKPKTEKKRKKKKKKKKRKKAEGQLTIARMNQHNYRVGRRAVRSSLAKQCKCHGVSGSCNIKTCWRSLPQFYKIGERLQGRYRSGVEVRQVRIGPKYHLLPASSVVSHYSRDDLIYITKSPDYCLPQDRLGSLGTHGRECNATSRGRDGCELMCCGRGYKTQVVRVSHRCHCRYHWCCYVTCKTCHMWVDQHTCN